MSRLFRNVAYNVVGQGMILLLGFVGVKFIFSRLGPDAFGIIYFSIVLTGVLTTALELGLLSTTVREVAAHSDSDRPYVVRLIRTASTVYWGLGLILMLAIFIAAPVLVERWINLRTIDPGTAATMLRYLSFTALIFLPRALYSSLFQGRQRMELNNGIDVASSAVQQLGIIAILARGGDAFQAVQWIAASAFLSTAAYLTVAARLFGWSALVPGYFRDVVDRNLHFTAHMGALSTINMVLLQFDKVVVSKLLPIASVGYYSFTSTVVVRISFAATAIAQAALPSFSSLHRVGDHEAMLVQYRKLQDLMCYGLAPLFAAAVFGALPLFGYLFNPQVAWLLLLPAFLLSLGFFMNATVNVPYTFSIAIGRPQIASRSNGLALLVVLPVTTVLVVTFGLVGAACSWIVYHLFLYAYMIPRICRECLEVGNWTWYRHLARVLALAGAAYGLAWLFLVVPNHYSLPALAAAYVAASILFLAGALLLIGPELRETIWGLPRRLMIGRAGGVQ